jgi:hypothetical protein
MKNTLLLGRTFFYRFFESELMPAGLPQVQLIIGALTLLCAPGLVFPIRAAGAYAMVQRNPEVLARMLIMHRFLFVTLTMIGIGAVALVIWEGVFPDRRDARILGVLPLRGRTLITARLGALSALAGIFVIGINAVPTVVYGAVISGFGAALTPLHGMAAHFVANVCAGAFIFFGLLMLQGLILNVAGRRLAEQLCMGLQILFIVGLLQLVFFFPRLTGLLGHQMSDLTGHPVLRFVPSVWFLALYDFVGGQSGGGPTASLAGVALLATLGVVVAGVGLFAMTHDRLAKHALESRDHSGIGSRLIARVFHWMNTRLIRNGNERAILQFTLRTLFRNRTHRMLLAGYVGAALALAVSGLVPVVLRKGGAGLTEPGIALLSVPFVVMFLALVGMRVGFSIPVDPKANWVVRLLEPANRTAAVNGARDAMMLAVVLPVTLLTALATSSLLDRWIATVHTTLCLFLGWVLAEILAATLLKIPFTCTYYPGLSKIRSLWPAYLTAFSFYCYTMPALTLEIESPRGLAIVVAILAFAILVAHVVRWRRLKALPGFRFEEEDPQAMFQGFNLSEGVAASRHD